MRSDVASARWATSIAPSAHRLATRIHPTRSAQELVPRSARGTVASDVRAVPRQPGGASARDECSRAIATLEPRMPAVARLLADAGPGLLARVGFPEPHRSRSRATSPQERPDEEPRRRTAVVGVFPARASAVRLVGMALAEQDDERQDGRRRFRPEPMLLIDAVARTEEVDQALLMAS